MLGLGLAGAVAGCAAPSRDAGRPREDRATPPPAPPSEPGIPSGPDQPGVLTHGPAGDQRIALTVDDGYCADCVAGYVDFAQRTGIHLTFSPNGTYGHIWGKYADTLRPLIERGQVQIMNHTFSHRDLRRLTDKQINTELESNEEWVAKTFGTSTRPYYRPPYGFHNPHIDGVAHQAGYTETVLWNGSYSDSEAITPEFLMSQARRYLRPGTIMLGHANHPAVLGLFGQIQDLITQRGLKPVTLDEMFGTSRNGQAG